MLHQLSPQSHETVAPARAEVSNAGRAAPRGRAKAACGAWARGASGSARAQARASRPRDASRGATAAELAQATRVRRGAAGARAQTARAWFRIVHFSVQADHVHLLVEADDQASLSRGLMGVAIRLARAVNRVVGRRGSVWADRYHARSLRTPREVRHGIVYVLMNWKKHSPERERLRPLLFRRLVRRVASSPAAGSAGSR